MTEKNLENPSTRAWRPSKDHLAEKAGVEIKSHRKSSRHPFRQFPGGAAETRNLHVSASRRPLQASCRLLDLDGRHAFKLLPDGLGLVLGRVPL